jgi:hypothetical protein
VIVNNSTSLSAGLLNRLACSHPHHQQQVVILVAQTALYSQQSQVTLPNVLRQSHYLCCPLLLCSAYSYSSLQPKTPAVSAPHDIVNCHTSSNE